MSKHHMYRIFPSINGNNQEHHSALMSGKIIFLLFLLLVELKYLHKNVKHSSVTI